MEHYSVTKTIKSCFCDNTEEQYEIRYRKTDIIWFHSFVESKKKKITKQTNILNKLIDKVNILVVLPEEEGEGLDKIGEGY